MVKDSLKGMGCFFGGIAALVVVILLAVFLIEGEVWVSAKVLPVLRLVNPVLLLVCVFVFAPLAIFKCTRRIAGGGFYVSSFVFGISLWMFACVITYAVWGKIGLFLGLMLAGVGVVPLGFIAAVLHGGWHVVFSLCIGLVLTFASRAVGSALLARTAAGSAITQRSSPDNYYDPSL